MAAGDTAVKAIVDSILKCLECPICLDLLDDPVATGCNHRFCRNCILTALKQKYTIACPLCKSKVTKRQLQQKVHLSEIVEIAKKLANTVEQDLLEKTIYRVCSSSNDVSNTKDKKDSNEYSEKPVSAKRKREKQQNNEVSSNKASKMDVKEANKQKQERNQILVEPDEEFQVKAKVSTNTNIQSGFPTRKKKKDSSGTINKYLIKSDDRMEQKISNNIEQNKENDSVIQLAFSPCRNSYEHVEENSCNKSNCLKDGNKKNANAKMPSKDTFNIKKSYIRSGRRIQKKTCEAKCDNDTGHKEHRKRNFEDFHNEVIDINRTKEKILTDEKENIESKQDDCIAVYNNQPCSSRSPVIDLTTLKRKVSEIAIYNDGCNDDESQIKQPVTITLDPYEFIPSQSTPKVFKKRKRNRTKAVKRTITPNLSSVDSKLNLSSVSFGTENLASSIEDFVCVKRIKPHTSEATKGFNKASVDACTELNDNDQQDNDNLLFVTPALNVSVLNRRKSLVQDDAVGNKVLSKSSSSENMTNHKKTRKSRDKLKVDLSTQEQISNWFDEISSAEMYTLNVNGVANRELKMSKSDKVCTDSDDGEFPEEVGKHDEILIAEECFDDNVLSDSSEDMICNNNDKTAKFGYSHDIDDKKDQHVDKQKPKLNSCSPKVNDIESLMNVEHELVPSKSSMVETCNKASINQDHISANSEKTGDCIQSKNEYANITLSVEIHDSIEMKKLGEIEPELINTKNEVDTGSSFIMKCNETVQDKNLAGSKQTLIPVVEIDSPRETTDSLQHNDIQNNNEHSYQPDFINNIRMDHCNNICLDNQVEQEQIFNIDSQVIEISNGTSHCIDKVVKNVPEENSTSKDEQYTKESIASKSQDVHTHNEEPESSLTCSRCIFNECVNTEESIPISAVPDTPQLSKNILQSEKNVSLINVSIHSQTPNECVRETALSVSGNCEISGNVNVSNKNQVLSSEDACSDKTEYKMPKRKTFSLEVESQELKELVKSNQHNTLDLLNEICMEFENSRSRESSVENSDKPAENEEIEIDLPDRTVPLDNKKSHLQFYSGKQRLHSQKENFQDEPVSSGKDSCEITCGQKECSSKAISTNQMSSEKLSEDLCICSGTCCCELHKNSQSKQNCLKMKLTHSNIKVCHNDFIQNNTPPTSDAEDTLNVPANDSNMKNNLTEDINSMIIPLNSIIENYEDQNLQNKLIATVSCPGCQYKMQLERVDCNLTLKFIMKNVENTQQRETAEQCCQEKVCVAENTGECNRFVKNNSEDEIEMKKADKDETEKCSNNFESNVILIESVDDDRENCSDDCVIDRAAIHEKYNSSPKIMVSMEESDLTGMVLGTVYTEPYNEVLCENEGKAKNDNINIVVTENRVNVETEETVNKDSNLNCHGSSPLCSSLQEEYKENEDLDLVTKNSENKLYNDYCLDDNIKQMSGNVKNCDEMNYSEMSEEIDPFLLRHNIPINNSIEKHNIERAMRETHVSSNDPAMIFAESLVAPLKTYHKINKESQMKNKSAAIGLDCSISGSLNNNCAKSTLLETLASCISTSPETNVSKKKPLHPSKTVNSLQSNSTKEKEMSKTTPRSLSSPASHKPQKKHFHRIRTMSNSDSDESADECMEASLDITNSPKLRKPHRVTRSLQKLYLPQDNNNTENYDLKETGRLTGGNWNPYGLKTNVIKSDEKKFSSSQMSHIVDLSEIGSNEEIHHTEVQEKIRVEIEQMKAQIHQMEIQLLKTESLNPSYTKMKEKNSPLLSGPYDSSDDSDDLFSPVPPTPPTSAHKEEKYKSMRHLR